MQRGLPRPARATLLLESEQTGAGFRSPCTVPLPKPRGRPSYLDNPKVLRAFIAALKASGSTETAIRCSAIGRNTFYAWQKKYRDGERDGGHVKANLFDFMEQVETTLGERKKAYEKLIYAHARTNWSAAAWWLERRFPEEYGRDRLNAQDDEPQDLGPPQLVIELTADDYTVKVEAAPK